MLESSRTEKKFRSPPSGCRGDLHEPAQVPPLPEPGEETNTYCSYHTCCSRTCCQETADAAPCSSSQDGEGGGGGAPAEKQGEAGEVEEGGSEEGPVRLVNMFSECTYHLLCQTTQNEVIQSNENAKQGLADFFNRIRFFHGMAKILEVPSSGLSGENESSTQF